MALVECGGRPESTAAQVRRAHPPSQIGISIPFVPTAEKECPSAAPDTAGGSVFLNL
jgi:hypothetical protein